MEQPNAQYSAEDHQRMKAEVLRKIERVYNISVSDAKFSPPRQKVLEKTVQEFFTSPYWCHVIAEQKKHAGNGKLDVDVLNGKAAKLLFAYIEGIFLREEVLSVRNSEIDPKYNSLKSASSRELIANAYINHITNIGMKQLEESGLNMMGALSVNGSIILGALDIAIQSTPYPLKCVTIEPSSTGKPPLERVEEINDHWRMVRDQLSK